MDERLGLSAEAKQMKADREAREAEVKRKEMEELKR